MTELQWTEHDVTVAGSWTYTWADRKRPHLHPVATPAGHVVTRDRPDDHPWHHGLWFTIKFVDGDNFWEEVPPYGVLRHDGPPAVERRADGSVDLTGTVTWTRGDQQTRALVEHRTLRHVPLGDDAYAIDLDTTLVPDTAVRLDRTEFTTWGGYGGLTLRGPLDWHDTRFVLADGSSQAEVLGVPSPWCEISGIIGSGRVEAPVGVALFDHPSNPRHPTPFYGRTLDPTYADGWTNFLNAAFLWDGPLDLAAGEPLRIRHRTLVHDGLWTAGRVHQAWTEWAIT